jgi:hypothetical protein
MIERPSVDALGLSLLLRARLGHLVHFRFGEDADELAIEVAVFDFEENRPHKTGLVGVTEEMFCEPPPGQRGPAARARINEGRGLPCLQ